MKHALVVCVLLLALASVARAEDYVGEDTVTPGKFRRYLASVSSTQAVPQNNEVLHVVSKTDTPAQRAINLGNPNAVPPVLPTVPVKYRKVVSGLVVEMTQGEKDVVEAALAAAAAARAAWQAEVNGNDVCVKNSLDEIGEHFDEIRADIAVEVTAMPGGAAKVATTEVATKILAIQEKMAKYICARGKVGR